MHLRFLLATCAIAGAVAAAVAAQQPAPSPGASGAPVSAPAALTIYNEDFAVARTTISLDLHPGINEISTNQITTLVEPDSVVLRDPAASAAQSKPAFRILEQNYDAGIVTQDWLLKKYEGKTIKFAIGNSISPDGHVVTGSTINGRIIRAPQPPSPYSMQYGAYQTTQPLIEVNGDMQFQLPGTPLFPATTDGLLLKPTLRWQINSDRTQKLAAELAYITGGMNWEATYNVIATDANATVGKSAGANQQAEEKADLVGWVTITNRTGADFPQARIKLMAGDVAKIEPMDRARFQLKAGMAITESVMVDGQVTQKAFDDYHLYDLNRTVALQDGETKQIQFLDTPGVTLARSYVYDGSATDRQPIANYGGNFIQQQNYGVSAASTKVQIVQQIKNTETNHLGIPLPAGRLRLYRRNSDGQIEFVGENLINHTPAEDTVKVTSGNAFDVKGSRRQTDFYVDNGRRTLQEYFEIKVTNQKADPITVSVLEHLYRGDNWEIVQKSTDYNKLDSHTIEFPIQVPAKGEATVTYSVRYTW